MQTRTMDRAAAPRVPKKAGKRLRETRQITAAVMGLTGVLGVILSGRDVIQAINQKLEMGAISRMAVVGHAMYFAAFVMAIYCAVQMFLNAGRRVMDQGYLDIVLSELVLMHLGLICVMIGERTGWQLLTHFTWYLPHLIVLGLLIYGIGGTPAGAASERRRPYSSSRQGERRSGTGTASGSRPRTTGSSRPRTTDGSHTRTTGSSRPRTNGSSRSQNDMYRQRSSTQQTRSRQRPTGQQGQRRTTDRNGNRPRH